MKVDPNEVMELVELTGKSPNECIDALLASDTREDTIVKLRGINIIDLYKKVRVGSIVVVVNPRLATHNKGITTKVLALLKNGVKSKSTLNLEIPDLISSDEYNIANFKTNDGSNLTNATIVLEELGSNWNTFKYLNKNCFIEYLGALRLATPKEKKKYYKHKQGRG